MQQAMPLTNIQTIRGYYSFPTHYKPLLSASNCLTA